MDLTKPCPGECGGSMMTCTCPGGNWYLKETADIEWCPKGCGRSVRMCTCPLSKHDRTMEQAVNLISVATAAETSGKWTPSAESEALLHWLARLLADRHMNRQGGAS